MKFELFDYQREAAIGCLNRLAKGRRSWTIDGDLSSFALSAVTGAGKTVIATAVIEALIYGSADLDFEADPRAVFLWVTDDPALNRQTRNKMLAGSDLLEPRNLIELNDGYLDSDLRPGRVYFLNIQQLTKTAGFSTGGSNLRQYSGWDILRNTIRSDDRDLYLILDEAHRGMKQVSQRPTIVQRIIAGQSGSNPPVPVVWGISATIERFAAAMKEHEGTRDAFAPVAVDIAKVRASGIVKDEIDIDKPGERGDFHATLLRSAVDATRDFESRWANYSEAEHEPIVMPVLVVQVADKPSEAHLAEIISVVEDQWVGRLGKNSVVNVFGEHADLVIGARKIRYVNPETIQENDEIRVVLAKEAISTGWDCPRAEVLFSERAASDATHIAQVIGRMVRSPLAHRVTTDDALNSVVCYLPRFERAALDKITDALTRPGEPGAVADVVVDARIYERNAEVDSAVFEFIQELPTWPKPESLANPLRRAKALVKLLTDESSGPALLPDAGAKLTATLNSKLDGLAAQHKSDVAANVTNLETAELRRTSLTITGEEVGTSSRILDTAIADIDRETRKIVGTLREGVGKSYVTYRVAEGGDESDELSIRTEVAALLLIDTVAASIDEMADRWVKDRLAHFAAEIKLTTGATKAAYMRVREMTSSQEQGSIELPLTMKTGTKSGNEEGAVDLPTFAGHIFSDGQGKFPAKLNEWEGTVVEIETHRPSFIAWYRNPARASSSALRIGYVDDNDEWQSLQIDFIVVSRRPDGTLAASIVDPHGDHLADALAKLKGLANYAERFGDQYVRVVSIAKGSDGSLRSLDLLEAKVREAVRNFDGARVTSLYDSNIADAYA